MNIATTYINPDCDGVSCIIALSYLLNKLDGAENWRPAIFGEIDEPTKFALEKCGIAAPESIEAIPENCEKIAICDTHHSNQFPAGFPAGKVCVAIDHHELGGDIIPETIYQRKCGAAASIVAEIFLGLDIRDEKMLKLLQFGIMENTWLFHAFRTQTEFDKRIFSRLSGAAFVPDQDFQKMIAARANILKSKPLSEIILADKKIYDTKFGKIAIGMLNITPRDVALPDLQTMRAELTKAKEIAGADFMYFQTGSPIEETTEIIADSEAADELMKKIFPNYPIQNGIMVADKYLIRKKDWQPNIDRLEKALDLR
jgi:inorganic pyrophosphatase/exopolyphosphatase